MRSLARDIGRMLGTGGMLTALRRTQVGPYEEADAVLASDLEGGFDPAALLRPVP
ncbi:MAG: hypothetical protein SFZ24_10720 [Planctomycetota bacterium]|nr:hypothetical protein [Planctomycetota bacterium]